MKVSYELLRNTFLDERFWKEVFDIINQGTT